MASSQAGAGMQIKLLVIGSVAGGHAPDESGFVEAVAVKGDGEGLQAAAGKLGSIVQQGRGIHSAAEPHA